MQVDSNDHAITLSASIAETPHKTVDYFFGIPKILDKILHCCCFCLVAWDSLPSRFRTPVPFSFSFGWWWEEMKKEGGGGSVMKMPFGQSQAALHCKSLFFYFIIMTVVIMIIGHHLLQRTLTSHYPLPWTNLSTDYMCSFLPKISSFPFIKNNKDFLGKIKKNIFILSFLRPDHGILLFCLFEQAHHLIWKMFF